jgi:hypothetical protein
MEVDSELYDGCFWTARKWGQISLKFMYQKSSFTKLLVSFMDTAIWNAYISIINHWPNSNGVESDKTDTDFPFIELHWFNLPKLQKKNIFQLHTLQIMLKFSKKYIFSYIHYKLC